MKACVIIPSYNGESTIGGVVKKIKDMGLDVLVIDDGSTDNTEKVSSENGAIVIRHAKNMGKGVSLIEGFDFILKATSFDTVIIMDGDGQHNPQDIGKFMSRAREHNDDDIIVGNRMLLTKNMPLVRLLTNKLMSLLLSLMCGQYIPDTQCGFKLIKRKVLESVHLESKRYDLDSELLIKAARKKFKISSVPIETIYKGEASSINPVQDTMRFISLIGKSIFK
jgi:glycosyltransferase involved in cell wall biosynthesis